jgi:hypothetical protein
VEHIAVKEPALRVPNRTKRGAIETAIERALSPGQFIGYGASMSFVSGLQNPAGAIEKLVEVDPERAVRLYETFLAGCYEKAEEIDDSGGDLGMFIDDLYSGWIKARQAANADPDETVSWLLARMDDDPYGFAYDLERTAVKGMSKANLAAFARHVRSRFDGGRAGEAAGNKERDAGHARHRWGEVLRTIYIAQHDILAYVALCELTELTEQDCLAIATLLRAKKPAGALKWVNRGLALETKRTRDSMAGRDLAKLKRELLSKLGRGGEALEEAWADYCEWPSESTYEELMRLVPNAKRAEWHVKAMDATGSADLGSLIALWLKTKEIDRLVERLCQVQHADLEELSHYTMEPAAKSLDKSYPDVAAKVFRALGMRILNAKKSKYYDAALDHFEDAKRCYERAGLAARWEGLVREVREQHHRKSGFIAGFEQVVAGGSRVKPTFLDRAKTRWLASPRD